MLLGVAVLQRGGELGRGDADATVELTLPPGADVDTARQEIAQRGAPAWQARQVGEVSESEDRTDVTFAMPGSNLASAVAWLRNRNNTGAETETVVYAVDPDQLELTPLSSAGAATAPAPVVLRVGIVASDDAGSTLVTVGWVLLAAAVVAAAVVGWRWYGPERA